VACSVVDACTVNAFKARLDKFWQHQPVKFDFTADLTGTGNRSEEVILLLWTPEMSSGMCRWQMCRWRKQTLPGKQTWIGNC